MLMWQPGMTLEDVEKRVIEQALRYYSGNKTQTAVGLGISVKTLYNKLHQYGVSDGQQRTEKDSRIQNAPNGSQRARENGIQTEAWVQVQPSAKVSAQQPVSLPVGEKVQTLPPTGDAPRTAGKRS